MSQKLKKYNNRKELKHKNQKLIQNIKYGLNNKLNNFLLV